MMVRLVGLLKMFYPDIITLVELTSISTNDMYALTGSGITDVDSTADFRTTTI